MTKEFLKIDFMDKILDSWRQKEHLNSEDKLSNSDGRKFGHGLSRGIWKAVYIVKHLFLMSNNALEKSRSSASDGALDHRFHWILEQYYASHIYA